MAKKSTLVLGPKPYFATCGRCGKLEPMPELPMPLDAFVKYTAYVLALHTICSSPSLFVEEPYGDPPEAPTVRTCRECGCTDERACAGGCSWVESDLCSACAPAEGHARRRRTKRERL